MKPEINGEAVKDMDELDYEEEQGMIGWEKGKFLPPQSIWVGLGIGKDMNWLGSLIPRQAIIIITTIRFGQRGSE